MNLKAALRSWNPDKALVIGPAFVVLEIPILGVPEASGVAVEESEVGPGGVQIGMNKAPVPGGGQVLGIKEPNDGGGPLDRGEPDGTIGVTGAVHVLVEAVVEQVPAVAATLVGWTNPYGTSGSDGRVRAPRHVVVAGQPQLLGKLDVPTCVGVGIGRVLEPLRRQEVVVVSGIQVRREPPLPEVVQADDSLGFALGFAQSGQQQAGQDGNDGDNHQKLDQGKGDTPTRSYRWFLLHNGKLKASIDKCKP